MLLHKSQTSLILPWGAALSTCSPACELPGHVASIGRIAAWGHAQLRSWGKASPRFRPLQAPSWGGRSGAAISPIDRLPASPPPASVAAGKRAVGGQPWKFVG
eukprot:72567-Chlamydomonas_euryale.AAC.3